MQGYQPGSARWGRQFAIGAVVVPIAAVVGVSLGLGTMRMMSTAHAQEKGDSSPRTKKKDASASSIVEVALVSGNTRLAFCARVDSHLLSKIDGDDKALNWS